MTPQEFIAKWERANLSERSACQQHFLDLCELLGQLKPAAADPDGAWYTFERGVSKTDGGHGWADVWMRGHFGWEYKRKHRDLQAAYSQLQLYREALENPPLLVVCDLSRFEIHTNFTGTAKRVYAFALAELAEPKHLDVLRKLFTDPNALRPDVTPEGITDDASRRIGLIADGMRSRGVPAPDAAHFLMKLMFCMFGEDIKLLPDGIFSKILGVSRSDPAKLSNRLTSLFKAMSTGGDFGAQEIPYFNGGLFADAEVIDLTRNEIDELVRANEYDWAEVEPSIFGSLFERTLDPNKRAQIGAHYTSRQDIETLLQPVVMEPLQREWNETRIQCDALWEKVKAPSAAKRAQKRTSSKPSRPVKELEKRLRVFIERLGEVTILDPACGSGNFLYVAIHLLLDLEKEVIGYGASRGISLLPNVLPTQLAGIEINPYAQQLAQVVIWIGYLQWMYHNGFNPPRDPVLQPIESIRLMDAILDLTDSEHPREPEWPKADFIVGNPPFLGDKKMKGGLGKSYVDNLRMVYSGRIPGGADLVTYWFEKSRAAIERRRTKRAGLIATQSIRVGANRSVLNRIKESGDIFAAWRDRPWVVEGAAVRVSLICFDNGSETTRLVDDAPTSDINADLSTSVDLTHACPLRSNQHLAFVGDQKTGQFELKDAVGLLLLTSPTNVQGCPNSDVIRPWVNAKDITGRPRGMWIVDFLGDTEEFDAAKYEGPFEHVRRNVLPSRLKNAEESLRRRYWLHARPRPEMRECIGDAARFLVTPRVAKHRIFVWIPAVTIPDSRLFVFATEEDCMFGVVHSRVHEAWSLATSPRHGVGNDPTYNAVSCFETFPFPYPNDAQRQAIVTAARDLDGLRSKWLNPPELTREKILEFPGSVSGPWARYVHNADASGVGTVQFPRLVPRDAECAKQLSKRTLTKLYNDRPTWLELAHCRLDEAVISAYGWPQDIRDEEVLARLLDLNLSRPVA